MSTENKPAELELTPEQTELNRKRFLYNMNLIETDPDLEKPEVTTSLNAAQEAHNPAPKEEEKPPAEEKPKEEEAKPAEEEKPVEEEAPKEEKEEKPLEVEASAMVGDLQDPEEIATRAATKAIEMSRPAAATPPAASQFEAQLPDEYKRELEVLRHLEQTNPAFKGTADKTLQFYQRETAYMDAWLAKNPGMEFDADGAEHEAFYKQMPHVPEDVLVQGRTQLDRLNLKRELKEEVMKELTPGQAQEKFEKRMDQMKPEIAQREQGAVLELIQKVDPALHKLMEVDGKAVVTQETVAALEKANPVAFEILNENAEKVRIMTAELHKLVHLPGEYSMNQGAAIKLVSTDEAFYPHAELERFAVNLEGELAKLPPANTVRDGKRFITQAEVSRRVKSISEAPNMRPDQKESAIRDLQDKTWTLGQSQIERALVAEYAAKSRTRLKRLGAISDDSTADAKGSASATSPKPASGQPKAVPVNGAKPVQKAAPAAPAKKPPTTATASDKMDTTAGGAKVDGLTKEKIIGSMWG